MIIKHFGITVDIPPMEFGNVIDIQIRDEWHEINKLMSPMKRIVPHQEKRVKEKMRTLQYLVKQKNEHKIIK